MNLNLGTSPISLVIICYSFGTICNFGQLLNLSEPQCFKYNNNTCIYTQAQAGWGAV